MNGAANHNPTAVTSPIASCVRTTSVATGRQSLAEPITRTAARASGAENPHSSHVINATASV